MRNNILFYIVFFALIGLQAQKQAQAPNVLFIAIDDLKPTLGSYGDSYAITPNLDKLGAKATVFLNKPYATGSLWPLKSEFDDRNASRLHESARLKNTDA